MSVKAEFLKKYKQDAILVGLACDISPVILLAQAALETGWGRYIVANNLYGIKDVPWLEGSLEAMTKEYDGEWKTELHKFQVFNSTLQSMIAYVVKVRTEKRYAIAWANRKDYKTYFTELKKAGYATDPDYATKLMIIYESLITTF